MPKTSFDDIFVLVLTFSISSHPRCHPINPPPAEENLITSARLCEIRDLLHLISQKARACTCTKTLTSARAVNEGERLWRRSILFTGRLLLLTFIVAPGGRELHANATEAFSAKGPGPPVSASSQVYSR